MGFTYWYKGVFVVVRADGAYLADDRRYTKPGAPLSSLPGLLSGPLTSEEGRSGILG